MSKILRLGVLAAALLACLGCSNTKLQEDANAESKKLEQDPEYAKKMQGQMGGAAPSK